MLIGDNLPLSSPDEYIIFFKGPFVKKGAHDAEPAKSKCG
jgi:hypothetical protein